MPDGRRPPHGNLQVDCDGGKLILGLIPEQTGGLRDVTNVEVRKCVRACSLRRNKHGD
jgi:hypothetical protein